MTERVSIGPYRVLERLGEHGAVESWLCRRPGPGPLTGHVAVKILGVEHLGDAARMWRFAEEGRVLAALDHPHIPRLEDQGTYAGAPFLVTEHVEGPTVYQLQQARHRADRHDARLACRIAADVARALAYAWDRTLDGESVPLRLAHGHVDPHSIVVSRKGTAKLLGFGAPVHFADAVRMGRLRFLAPETVLTQEHTHASDLFSLGVVLYGLLVGQHPWRVERVDARLVPPPPLLRRIRPEIPAALESVVRRLLDPDPERRYAHGQGLADELEDWLTRNAGSFTSAEGARQLQSLVPPGGWRHLAGPDGLEVPAEGRPPATGRRIPWRAVGVSAVLLCVLLAMWGWSANPARDLDRAEAFLQGGDDQAAQVALRKVSAVSTLEPRLLARLEELQARVYLAEQVRIVQSLLSTHPEAALLRAQELDREFPREPLVVDLVERASRFATPSDPRAPKSAPVGLSGTPEGAEAWVDGELVGALPLEVRLAPGPHRVTVRHPDYATRTWTVQAVAEARVELEVALPRERATGAGGTDPPSE